MINTAITILDRPLHTSHNWEDFFDFSRMSKPSDRWTVCRRLKRNLGNRFIGNYLRLETCAVSICGIVLDHSHRPFGIASSLLMFVWILWSSIGQHRLSKSRKSNIHNRVVGQQSLLLSNRITIIGKRVSCCFKYLCPFSVKISLSVFSFFS